MQKKFGFKNEDQRHQIKRVREQEFRRALAGRDPEEHQLDIGMSGTTGTIVIILDQNIYYGWVGDSLLCMSRQLDNACSKKILTNNDFILTKPLHVPCQEREKHRIYKFKGEVRGDKN